MLKNGKDKTISIRLSQAMLEALDARAILNEKDRTQVIREAIAQYLDLPEDEIEGRIESLEHGLEKLQAQTKRTELRTESLEVRVSELSSLMAIIVQRVKK